MSARERWRMLADAVRALAQARAARPVKDWDGCAIAAEQGAAREQYRRARRALREEPKR